MRSIVSSSSGDRVFSTVMCALLAVLTAGCAGRDFEEKAAATAENASGRYIRTWDTGEVEVLILEDDMKYEHLLFADIQSASAGNPVHSSKGSWSREKRGYGNFEAVVLSPYFSFYDHQQQTRPNPGIYGFKEYTMFWNPFWDEEHPRLQHTEDGDDPYLSRSSKMKKEANQPVETTDTAARYPRLT